MAREYLCTSPRRAVHPGLSGARSDHRCDKGLGRRPPVRGVQGVECAGGREERGIAIEKTGGTGAPGATRTGRKYWRAPPGFDPHQGSRFR